MSLGDGEVIYRLVEVEWLDSIGRGGWDTAGAYLKDLPAGHMLQRSSGYVLRDDSDGILLVQSYRVALDADETENNRHVEGSIAIPRVAILSVRTLYKRVPG